MANNPTTPEEEFADLFGDESLLEGDPELFRLPAEQEQQEER